MPPDPDQADPKPDPKSRPPSGRDAGAPGRPTDPRVDAIFATATLWPDELAAVRAILGDTELTEEFKWRAPCYTFAGGNVAMLWGFREACTLGFFKGVLMADPEGVLAAPGENSRASRTLRFTSVAQVHAMEPVIRAYVAEAIGIETAGMKVEFPKDDLPQPAELTARLAADPALRAAFAALTPGRQRGWVLQFSAPKRPDTRSARIDRAAPRILQGKGPNDR